jgi:hypothetical protein
MGFSPKFEVLQEGIAMHSRFFGFVAVVLVGFSIVLLTKLDLRAENNGPCNPPKKLSLSEMISRLKELREEEQKLIVEIKRAAAEQKKSIAAEEENIKSDFVRRRAALDEQKKAQEEIEKELKALGISNQSEKPR